MTSCESARASAGTITVRCLLFARFAEIAGREALDLSLPAEATVGDALRALRVALQPGPALPEHPLAAVNRVHVPSDRVLADGDELAVLPPLSGG